MMEYFTYKQLAKMVIKETHSMSTVIGISGFPFQHGSDSLEERTNYITDAIIRMLQERD